MLYRRLCGGTIALTLIFAMATPATVEAQVTGTLSGYVTDPSGGAVPGTLVTATLIERNTSTTAESNAEGFYSFPFLQPGAYTVMAEKPGFQKLTQTDVALTVNQNVRLDLA